MKKRAVFILAAMSMLTGCSMDDVQSWGDSCPPRENAPEGAYLSYIGAPVCTADTQAQCDVSVLANKDIGLYFRTQNCPPEYKNCVQDENSVGFHCEKDKETVVVTECAKGQKLCKNENGENFCLDPAFIGTCGAYDCEAKDSNYGGKNCAEFDDLTRCELNAENKYVCKCPNGALLCNDQCINPNSASTCGAYDCALENYGGIDCQKGGAVCSNGRCTCLGSGIWCRLDGEEEGEVRCIEPQENETCNARLVEDADDVCVVSPCDQYQLCVLSGDNEYSCRQNSCISEEMLCKVDDEWQCISKLDEHNCGSCYVDCGSKIESNAHGVRCVNDEDGEYVCTYECEEGFTNCGNELRPNCVSLSTFQHCGECNKACQPYEYCNNGKCETTVCKETECTLSGVTNGEVCVNTAEKCGKDCQNCLNVHANAACLNGLCVISECNEGEHPEYGDDNSTQIQRCLKNTAESCAPFDRKVGDEIVNCLENMPENVVQRDCGSEGTCIVVACMDDFHISDDETGCVKNTSSACGSGKNVVNCATIENSQETACIMGTCYVSACKEGYHLSEDHLSCEENKPSSCAPVISSAALDCTKAITDSALTECSQEGTCVVSQCLSGFHLSADHTACEANSETACAPTDSDKAVKCSDDIKNSVTTRCDAGICKVSVCAENYHIAQDKVCELNTDKLCGAPDSDQTIDCNDAISHSSKTECLSGVCSVKECASGFHPSSDNKSCVQDSATKCAVGGVEVDCNDKIKNSAETACEAGVCKAVRCASDFHISSDGKSCVDNSDTQCAPTNSKDVVNCNNKILDSVETKCISGECSVTKCSPNHHLAADKKTCVENSSTSCAAVNSSNAVDCSSEIKFSSRTACSDGVCTVSDCDENYHLMTDHKSCVKNSSEQCAATNSDSVIDCNIKIKNSSKTVCGAGGVCQVTDCKPDFHLSGDTGCVGNSDKECAATNSASPVDCSKIDGYAAETACKSGACSIVKCVQGYHLNPAKTGCVKNENNLCAPVDSNSPVDCTNIPSASSASCNGNGKCVVSACSGNNHISADKTSCEPNSKDSCGSGTSVSPSSCMTEGVATASCPAGVCVVSNCNTGYHISSDGKTCEANSVTKCAATNSSSTVSCKTEGVATTSCSTGVCQVSACNSGYHISSDKKSCVANSNTSCASTTSSSAVNCTTLTNVVSASCNSQGACVVTECQSGNHIKSDKTACEANSNTSCAATTSNAPVSCMTTGVKTATCSGGACVVSACTSNTYHIKSDKTACETNSNTSCAKSTSSTPVSCMTTGVKTAACTEGVCVVSACTSNAYHIKSDKSACESNTNTSCGLSTSTTVTNCQTLSNIAGTSYGTCDTSTGKCKVTKCKSTYHIKSDGTGCEANTDTACGAVDAKGKNCTSNKYDKVCNKTKGYCSCSADDSTVLNYNGTACISKYCGGFYGAITGKTGAATNSCMVTKCSSDFVTDGNTAEYWGTCRPIASSTSTCNALPGWSASSISGGQCWATTCKSGYNKYHATCQPANYCCGSSCVNCTLSGKTCSSGSCV